MIQRAARAEVRVDGAVTGRIGRGLVVLAAFAAGDGEAELAWMAAKLPDLRRQVSLVVPARPDGAAAEPDRPESGSVRIVEAAPARFERPGHLRERRDAAFRG